MYYKKASYRKDNVYVNEMRSVGKQLIKIQDKIKISKSLSELVSLVESIDQKELSTESKDYFATFCEDVKNSRDFKSGLSLIYNVILAGYNLRVIQ
jgi:hypothetical protein